MMAPQTIPHAAQNAASLWPDNPAIITEDKTWSFSQLWDDAQRCGEKFLRAGLKRGDRIAIWAPNLPEWIITALGAQITGASIVPLNTRFKGREAGDLLRRTKAKFLFTVKDFLGADYSDLLKSEDLPDLEAIHYLDGENSFAADQEDIDHTVISEAMDSLDPDTFADIIFTSGTTGAPKGAMTTHKAAINLFTAWADRVDLRRGDRYLIINPFFHTFGYKAGWVIALAKGATIVPLPIFDIPETIRQIEKNGISFLPGPPTIYQSLLQALGGKRRPDFSSLRVAVTGAAPVAPALVDRMKNELGMGNVVNGYGMTEHGAISMTCQGDDDETVANTCGCPLPGVEVRCVDDAGCDVDAGEIGEFWIRSPFLMSGYMDDPKATADTINSDGWLKTGDVGIMNAAGYLKITDRKKDMYISGGFNCYPAEIESILAGHPSVEMVAIVAVPDERMGEVGKAFIVPRPNTSPSADEIIAWSRENMANYKVPHRVEFIDELPKNAGGKVLRRVLREA